MKLLELGSARLFILISALYFTKVVSRIVRREPCDVRNVDYSVKQCAGLEVNDANPR